MDAERSGRESQPEHTINGRHQPQAPAPPRPRPTMTQTPAPPGVRRSQNGSRPQAMPQNPGPLRRRDPRERYQGFTFVFSTDAYHDESRTFNLGIERSVTYLKPMVRGETKDSLPPMKLPYFFTGFTWRDEDGVNRMTSRVEVCYAWQVAFNQLLYYGSFAEEAKDKLEPGELSWCKERFSQWNDLFTEVDEALGRISACERLRYAPTFSDAQPVSSLDNPYNRTSTDTPLDGLASTFLAAVTEVITRNESLASDPFARTRQLERRLSPWEPCRGSPILHMTSWSADRVWPRGIEDAMPPRGGLERRGSGSPEPDC